MSITKKEIKSYFSKTIYNRGNEYHKEDRVQFDFNGNKYEEFLDLDVKWIRAKVQGSHNYYVSIPLNEDDEIVYESMFHAQCDCPHYDRTGWECKHMVATFLAYVDYSKNHSRDNSQSFPHSDSKASQLLDKYLQNRSAEKIQGEISLTPLLHVSKGHYPKISFQIGKDKMYILKDISQFLNCIDNNLSHKYGKNFEFTHNINQFTPKSQELIQILKNNRKTLRTSYNSSEKRLGRLDGNGFFLFFQLFSEKSMNIDDWIWNDVYLTEGNPNVSILIQKVEQGANIQFTSEEKCIFYGNDTHLYALTEDKFYLCTPEFTKKIAPLVDFYETDLFISQQDLPTFCDTVLYAVKNFITLQDDDDISTKFTPDDCTPCFYFDLSGDHGVNAQLKFRYGETIIPQHPSPEEIVNIRLNPQTTLEAKEKLETYFTLLPNSPLYQLHDDEDQFITEHLDTFRQFGDVFLSNSIENRFVDRKITPSIGVSVSDGLLTLDMDTGDFPVTELEALYDSLLRKKKYHKLKDGRFLFLDGSGYEKVAEISHMLQLSPKDFKRKTIKLPAYRGLYLDSVLDSKDQIKTTKNQAFRHMMKDFKSVAESDYQPPDTLQTTLRPYQILGFQWMKTLEQYGFGGILADEMGLGKTVQVITYLLSLDKTEPSLVVCPASLLLNWGDELARFAPSLKTLLLLGSAKERKTQILEEQNKPQAEQAQVWVTSYDLLKRDKALYEDLNFYTCILDEGQNIKNQSSLVSKTVKTIQSQQRFVLTGTPIENRLSELWNLFDFLMPGYLFSHNTFVSKLEKPIVKTGDPTAGRQLSLLVHPFLMRRLKKDVLTELPDKIEHVRNIHLSEEERKVYAAAVTHIKSQALQGQSKLQILAQLTHLRQLCCDPSLCFENYNGESSKLESCIELCTAMVENGHKILLFSQFTSMLDILRTRLNQQNISHLTIEGATSKPNRSKYVKEFQNGNVDVFLISLKAGGTGLNLTNADVVIHYDPWWNQASQNQATDRAHRIGQKQHVQVYKLIAQNTIEEKILALQEKKAQLMETVVSEVGDEPLTQDDILALLD